MRNLDKVFLVVKQQCENQKKMALLNNFEVIAKESGLSIEKLEKYLNHLQELNLIKFSITDRYIYLTADGHRQDTVNV